MIGIKTEKGMVVLKDRSVSLSPKMRAAFILCDGKRSIEDVLLATSAMGVTLDDLKQLFQLGLLTDAPEDSGFPAFSPSGLGPLANGPPLERTRQQRYQDAYPVAIRLTSSLGLRGFRLNLSVEAASSYEELRTLAPRIRDAVGAQSYMALERALFS
jgi:hypothetical protein